MSKLTFCEKSNSFLAPYACFSEKSKGRLNSEKHNTNRSEYQRDRDRILHCTAFRRLEYKTQVFLNNEGDHYRTRLTHSLEVAQLARAVARVLKLEEDLAETISLAHDLGHSPFGHAGEEALQECMDKKGGLTTTLKPSELSLNLNKNMLALMGLNLSWETLEGLAKHNGPVSKAPRALAEFNKTYDLKLKSHASLEAQIAAICDDVAYNSHDIEDGVRAGLFSIDEVQNLKLLSEEIKYFRKKTDNMSVILNEVRSRFIRKMLDDVYQNIEKNIKKYKIKNANDVRNCGVQIVDFSPEFKKQLNEVRAFLKQRMYHHYKVLLMTNKAKQVVRDLFNFYEAHPDTLPTNWAVQTNKKSKNEIAVIIADFIAGMTDRYAFIQHNKIFGSNFIYF